MLQVDLIGKMYDRDTDVTFNIANTYISDWQN